MAIPATPEEQAKYDEAKKKAEIDCNRRKISYADAETDIIRQEKKMEAISLLYMIAKKYDISQEDLYILLEHIPFI